MHRLVLPAALSMALAALASPAVAGPTFSLSSPNDLTHLTVGQQFEIDVNLAGLPANDFIFNLNTKVLFSPSLFLKIADPTSLSGLTATVTPGSVFYNNVQGPLQIANFNALSSLTSSSAIGIFAEAPNTMSGAIGLNGLYYSFLLKATATGSGSIAFDPTTANNEYAANDTGYNYAPLVITPGGGSLAFSITPAAVPEPSSIVLAGIAGLCLAAYARRSGKPAVRARPIG